MADAATTSGLMITKLGEGPGWTREVLCHRSKHHRRRRSHARVGVLITGSMTAPDPGPLRDSNLRGNPNLAAKREA